MGIVAKKNILKIRIFYKIFCHKLLLLFLERGHPPLPQSPWYHVWVVRGTHWVPDHPLTDREVKETRLV